MLFLLDPAFLAFLSRPIGVDKLDFGVSNHWIYFSIRFQTSRFSSPGRVEPIPEHELSDFEICDIDDFRDFGIYPQIFITVFGALSGSFIGI